MEKLKQNSHQKIYSKSLKRIMAMKMIGRSDFKERVHTQRKVEHHPKVKGQKMSKQQLMKNIYKYQHHIDTVMKQLIREKNIQVQVPFLRRKHSYHNIRIKSHRDYHDEQMPQDYDQEEEKWKKEKLPVIRKEVKTKTQPKQYELSQQRQGIYDVVKQYRLKSLKNMELQIDVNQLRKWHERNKDLALKHEIQSYKLKKIGFHLQQ